MIANSSDNDQLNVAIVGGGIGGLCLAIGLIKYPHVNVQIYEAVHKFAEIGAGLTVNPNARRALKLLDPGIERALLKLQTGNSADFVADKNTYCRFVWGAGPKGGQTITRVWCEDGQQSVHRAHFLDELVKLVPLEICNFNKRLTAIKEEHDGRVTLSFGDGSTATADCVIGADGVHSSVRQQMVPEGGDHQSYDPTYSEFAGYRGLIPMDQARAALGDELSLVATMHCGPGALLMSYPINYHKQLNIVAVDGTRKEWQGEAIQPADPDRMNQVYAGWTPAVRKIIELIQGPAAKIWSLWQIPNLPSFVQSKIALLGDAAHAMVPFHAQGAAQAIEDALVLSNLLGKVRSEEDLRCALQAYDRIRRPRAQGVVKASCEGGKVFTMQHPGVLDDEEIFKNNVENRYDLIINRDMQLQVDQALLMAEDLKMAAKQKTA